MKVTKTKLDGVLLIKPKVFEDNRGSFKESYNVKSYSKIGINDEFVQDNTSTSFKGVLRGLHSQLKTPQGKLVSCTYGEVFDVAVDVNKNSDTYGQYVGFYLSDKNNYQLWIPPGYAHGFCVLSDYAHFHYKCTQLYNKDDEIGYRWDDPFFKINWPIRNPIVSDKDNDLQFVKDDLANNIV